MIFSGVFERYPRLKVGSVEHETAWVPHWLQQMDFTYRERPLIHERWRSREGMLPSDYWQRNMFVEFMEDEIGIRLRDLIGTDQHAVGQRLSARGVDVAALAAVPRPHLCRRARRGAAQDHGR